MRIRRGLDMVLFSVSLPETARRGEEGKEKTEKDIIAAMEQFYASLSSIKNYKKGIFDIAPHFTLEIALPAIGEEVLFYFAVPKRLAEVAEREITGFFSDAQVERVNEDYNIFNPQGKEAIGFLTLEKKSYLPFRTFQDLEVDPLGRISAALSKLQHKGEGAAIQILARPASGKWKNAGQSAISQIQKTGKLENVIPENKNLVLDFLGSLFSLGKKEEEKKELVQLTPLAEEAIKTIENKINKTVFLVNVRLAASAQSQERAEQILQHLTEAFTQFDSPNFNKLKPKMVKANKARKMIFDFCFRQFNESRAMVLSTEELTSLYHFPINTAISPDLKRAKALSAPVPANLPQEGIIVGKNIFRGEESIVRVAPEDRRRHLYIVGQTGTGKSGLQHELIRQDVQEGRGVGVIDPHGDLVEEILGLVPKERAEDVILINPGDLERPIGLNMLEYNPAYPEQKTFIINELINIFDKLYDLKTTGGPMFEQYTRNALLLLMDDPTEPVTFMEVPRVLADDAYRKRLLAKCKNLVAKNFWEKEAEKAGGEAALVNMVPYITSKFNVFIANDYMRPIIGQVKSSLNFREIIDQKKILLVNLTKGKVGDINSSLLGLIIVGKLLIAAFSRVDLPQDQRQDFYLYIDEFQNFTTPSIATILSEARKYRLCLTIAHQFIGQLPENIRDAVFGNVGNLACFRVGADDAEFLVKQFAPVFSESDLINIDNFNAYAKIMINGKTSKGFNIATFPPQNSNLETAQIVKEISRLKYGRERNQVEQEIIARMENTGAEDKTGESQTKNSVVEEGAV